MDEDMTFAVTCDKCEKVEGDGTDPVTNPSHYAGDGKVSCMDAAASMAANYRGVRVMPAYWCLSALKYLFRAPRKNGTQDLLKAKRCIEYAIDDIREHEDD